MVSKLETHGRDAPWFAVTAVYDRRKGRSQSAATVPSSEIRATREKGWCARRELKPEELFSSRRGETHFSRALVGRSRAHGGGCVFRSKRKKTHLSAPNVSPNVPKIFFLARSSARRAPRVSRATLNSVHSVTLARPRGAR